MNRVSGFMVSMIKRIGKTKILKNPVPESEPIPFGFYCYALTNKDTAERVAFGLCPGDSFANDEREINKVKVIRGK